MDTVNRMLNSLLLMIVTMSPSAGASIADAAWLTGCWKLTTPSRSVTEQWLPPAGETMIGVSRTVSGGKTVAYEFLLLRVGQNGIEYVATPSGQPEAVFVATRATASELIFENAAHDFPTRIAYRRVDGALVATIDGEINGKRRSIDFRYTAGDCTK